MSLAGAFTRLLQVIACGLVLLTSGLVALGSEFTNRPAPPIAHVEPNNLTGKVFGVGAEKSPPLYQYKRSASVSNQTVTVVWDYTYPDGKLAARERVTYDTGGLLSYGLSQTQTGEEGLATVCRDPRAPAKSRVDAMSITAARPIPTALARRFRPRRRDNPDP